MLSAFLHSSLGKPKSGLKSRIHGGRTMHRSQQVLDMDAQSRCMDVAMVHMLTINLCDKKNAANINVEILTRHQDGRIGI